MATKTKTPSNDLKENPPIKLIPVEVQTEVAPEEAISKTITMELEKANVTEAIISNLREKYMPLKLKDLNDKEGYLEIVDARKDMKKWMALTVQVCKRGREEAVLIQKSWINREKDVTARMGEVRDHLSVQEEAYEENQNKIKAEKKQAQDKAFALRNTELTGLGAVFNGTEYVSGDVSYELAMIRETDNETYETLILPKYKVVFDAAEEKRLADEKIKADAAAELERQQSLLKQQQQELLDQQNKLKAQQDEIDKQNKAREEKEEKDKQTAIANLFAERLSKLNGWAYNGFTVSRPAYAKEESNQVIFGSKEDLLKFSDEDFEKFVLKSNNLLESLINEKKQDEQIREMGARRYSKLKELEVENISENMGYLVDEEWGKILTTAKVAFDKKQKEKWESEKAEEQKQAAIKKQAELDSASDKEKFQLLVSTLLAVQFPEFKSKAFRERAGFIRDFLDGLK